MLTNATVFLVDDDADVRRSLSVVLQDSGSTIEEFESGAQFIADYVPCGGGCVLMDILMPDVSGLDVLDRIAHEPRANPVIMMTGQANVPMATRALESGAFAFIEKPFSRDVLIDRIRNAVEYDLGARRSHDRHDALQQRFLPLTPREWEVLDLVVAGRLTKQIAVQLGISQRTVETHRGNIMTKLRTDTLAELVAIAIENRNSCNDRHGAGVAPRFSPQRPWRCLDRETRPSR